MGTSEFSTNKTEQEVWRHENETNAHITINQWIFDPWKKYKPSYDARQKSSNHITLLLYLVEHSFTLLFRGFVHARDVQLDHLVGFVLSCFYHPTHCGIVTVRGGRKFCKNFEISIGPHFTSRNYCQTLDKYRKGGMIRRWSEQLELFPWFC